MSAEQEFSIDLDEEWGDEEWGDEDAGWDPGADFDLAPDDLTFRTSRDPNAPPISPGQ